MDTQFLFNPVTGTVDTSQNWEIEKKLWGPHFQKEFDSLVPVVYVDEKEEWVAVK